MVSFAVIMSAVFGQDPPQRTLTEQDHLGQAFLFNRADPSFREGIQKFGLLAGSGIALIPPVANADRNEAQNFESRSCRT